MKIGKINLTFFKELKFGRLRFLNPQDHFRTVKNLLGPFRDLRPGLPVTGIVESAGSAGIFFQQNRMAVLPHKLNSPGRQRHAILFSLDFF